MIIRPLVTLCCVLLLSDGVLAEGENEIKTGHHPFMAFIYYPDASVVEETGARYIRGAVLVKPEWLISSTVGPMMINDMSLGFPRKTLMARLGARSIDANFTLNEDEDEQEREVIQIVRPYNHSATQWWRDDISLLKTLVPFNLTAAIAIATIRSKPSTFNDSCYILVFAKRVIMGNMTDDKVLMQLYVEMQPASITNCGLHFYDTMVCASDSDENKHSIYDPQFCQGNSGGPLVCDNEVTGIQTYIENNCKQPYLYQLLSAWENFITCGIEDKCSEESCERTCMLINKDDQPRRINKVDQPRRINKDDQTRRINKDDQSRRINEDDTSMLINKDDQSIPINKDDQYMVINKDELSPSEASVPEEVITQASLNWVSAESTTVTELITIPVHSSTEIPEEDDVTTPSFTPSYTTASERLIPVGTTTTTTTTTTTEATTMITSPQTTTEYSTLSTSEDIEETEKSSEKSPERMKSFEEDENKIERKPNVEAQQQNVKKPRVKKMRGAAERNKCVFQSVFTLCILVTLM
ncbi:hypothetical protein ABMA28_016347 [Loxostege sticticalis]|uniref:Peptidase S1 domain-containing protein n=1 Tax=Loxostege sticticalis TaxID=481309 RepID=A0ABD0TBK1_LOXSC